MAKPAKAVHGTLIHSLSPTSLQVLPNSLITISSTGTILSLQPNISPSDIPAILAQQNIQNIPLLTLSHGQFLIPGFVDTHNHAPQWMQRGLGQGMHILDWLDGITFPNEAKFADPAHAEKVYEKLVRGMLRQGVTTASYYASLHGEATRVLASTCFKAGQRALIGKCNMDRNSPAFYCEASAEESIRETRACIRHIRGIDPEGVLIRPVLTPRFAISCTAELLRSLGDMAREDEGSLAIQTHFNEAAQEINATLSLFPEFSNEADLYSSFGLLTQRSILAHCTIMTEYEIGKLRELGCGVAHCPTANMTVGGGFMAAPVKEFLRRGVGVGLGTDSGGGYSSSMVNAMRHALVASYARDALGEMETGGGEALSLEEVFSMATRGGAKVVGLGERVGAFAVGMEFDALVIDLRDEVVGGVNVPLEEDDAPARMLEKFVMTGDDRNIVRVYVKGRVVHGEGCSNGGIGISCGRCLECLY
ncbi:guanine deaminase-like protein [Trichoderma reesei QM6a]|uniref:Probable guanine deaminase n=2 Tax=Hypocrea jecorina TaxID=51453 RepID=G0RQV9_HYPJQ|nr:guanine deaminase-like protein [Trichoderma reesei QM6a]EGR46416.1 guanine deaminase-like protein [Trichoderma reesei QM6a]ETR99563.1 Metallo-dependent hydrolase [Trichoderma reesei RUT C-30]